MGYKIAETRKAKGWNQQKLAEMMGTTQRKNRRFSRTWDALGVCCIRRTVPDWGHV